MAERLFARPPPPDLSASSDPNELLKLDLTGEGEVVLDGGGRPISVVGRFDVGLSERPTEPAALRGVSEFIGSHAAVFGGVAPTLVVRDIHVVDNLLDVVAFDQRVGPLRVVDSDITAAFFDDGTMQSLNGLLVDDVPQVAVEDPLGVAGVLPLVAASKAYRAISETRDDQWSFDGNAHRLGGASMERGFSVQTGGPAWVLTTASGNAVLDEESQVIVQDSDAFDPLLHACNVRHRDFTRSGGNTTSFAENTSVSIIEELECEGSEFLYQCYWQLRNEPLGFFPQHDIARILDDSAGGAEQEIVNSCAGTLNFTGTTADSLREQGAFYTAHEMRAHLENTVWGHASPNRDSNVQIHVDVTDFACAGFSDFTTDIQCDATDGSPTINCCSIDALSHEYGHYVVWTYNDVSQNCVAGSDEGDALDETLANVFGLLFVVDEEGVNPTYGALGSFALSTAPAAHVAAGSIVSALPNCGTPAPDRNDGFGFQQTVWELLWNRNCSDETCTATMAVGNRIWPGQNQTSVLHKVGGGLGTALSVLGTNITHQQVRAQLRSRVLTMDGTAAAACLQRVFNHHGLVCPTCSITC